MPAQAKACGYILSVHLLNTERKIPAEHRGRKPLISESIHPTRKANSPERDECQEPEGAGIWPGYWRLRGKQSLDEISASEIGDFFGRVRRHQEALFKTHLTQHKKTLKIKSLRFPGRYPTCRTRKRKFDNVTFGPK